MSTKVIGDYSAASTIDGANHYLLIQPGNSSTGYLKINRNIYLGVTGQPVDISTAQNITNKSFNNTNTLTLKDTLFTLQDDSDATKQAQFQLSGITTGTTRTYTLPNASSTLADISTAQTLTNKSLTSPTISGGTIDNTTITVDSISGHTTSTIVTVGGVQMNNGTIGTSSAVVTASIADSAVTPAKLLAGTGSGWSWQSFTSTFTNLTVNNGTQNSSYTQIGKTVIARIDLTFGTTSAISGAVVFTLPVTAATMPGTATVQPIGTVQMYDGGSIITQGWVAYTSTTTGSLYVSTASGTYVAFAGLSSTIPYTWSAGKEIHILLTYQAA